MASLMRLCHIGFPWPGKDGHCAYKAVFFSVLDMWKGPKTLLLSQWEVRARDRSHPEKRYWEVAETGCFKEAFGW